MKEKWRTGDDKTRKQLVYIFQLLKGHEIVNRLIIDTTISTIWAVSRNLSNLAFHAKPKAICSVSITRKLCTFHLLQAVKIVFQYSSERPVLEALSLMLLSV